MRENSSTQKEHFIKTARQNTGASEYETESDRTKSFESLMTRKEEKRISASSSEHHQRKQSLKKKMSSISKQNPSRVMNSHAGAFARSTSIEIMTQLSDILTSETLKCSFKDDSAASFRSD